MKKIILQGKLNVVSPLAIGSGRAGILTNSEVVKNADQMAVIPGTSLCGAMRAFCYQNLSDDMIADLQSFFGYAQGDQAKRSVITVCDIVLNSAVKNHIVVRDSVKMNEYGVAEDGKKYDYEIVEPGIAGDLTLEVVDPDDKAILLLQFIKRALGKGRIALGAMNGRGFGKVRLEAAKFMVYDFSKPQNVFAWLKRTAPFGTSWNDQLPNGKIQRKHRKTFLVKAAFALKTSLLIKGIPGAECEADDVAMRYQADHTFVLPGSSVRGVVRARAKHILDVLASAAQISSEDVLQQLFGYVNEETKKKRHGKITFAETKLDFSERLQYRNRIDRFTGGVMSGALFNAMALWPDQTRRSQVQIAFAIENYEDWEAGLLLLALKDLWTGHLPLGGEKSIGRGVLRGISAKIICHDGDRARLISLKEKQRDFNLHEDKKRILENFVKALQEKCGGEAQ